MIEIEPWKLLLVCVSGPVVTSLVWWLGLRRERRERRVMRRTIRDLERVLHGEGWDDP